MAIFGVSKLVWLYLEFHETSWLFLEFTLVLNTPRTKNMQVNRQMATEAGTPGTSSRKATVVALAP